MIQGIWLLTAMCAALIVLWWRSEWKLKKTEHRVERAESLAEHREARIEGLEAQNEYLADVVQRKDKATVLLHPSMMNRER